VGGVHVQVTLQQVGLRSSGGCRSLLVVVAVCFTPYVLCPRLVFCTRTSIDSLLTMHHRCLLVALAFACAGSSGHGTVTVAVAVAVAGTALLLDLILL
jgi:hypothetical protein